jgi:hypothetical protein
MTDAERRGNQRCPVCQGPGVSDERYAESIKCRNSLCTHNHAGITCPRCKGADLESVSYKSGAFSYRCADCQNGWEAKLEG